jgi:penicillin-binding protein 2
MHLRLILVLFFVVWSILLVRVYTVSIASNDRYSHLAIRNTIKTESIIPVRGNIYDRNGVPMAVNKLGFKVLLKPHLRYKKRRPQLKKLMSYIHSIFPKFEIEKLTKRYLQKDSHYAHNHIVIIPFIPYEKMLPHFTELNSYEGIRIEPATLRYYPNSEVASHILGYVAKSKKREGDEAIIGVEGRTGIERFYNKALQGTLGKRTYQVTATNVEIAQLDQTDASTNQDLTLNIDIELQKVLHSQFQDQAGVGIIMDAHTGALLAAGSYPEYNINQFVTGISAKKWKRLSQDLNHPFINKLLNSNYPPGSVVKPTIGLSFMESPWFNSYTSHYCSGSYEFGNRNFRCWKETGHKETRLREAIRESCDIYFYKGSEKVGINNIAQKLRDFGFGVKSGIDLPNEFVGIVPDKNWKLQRYNQRWYIGETFNTAIGQGSFLATPIQIARNTALLATDKLVTPLLAKSVAGKEINGTIDNDVFSPSDKRYIKQIRRAMMDVMNAPRGTATRYAQTPLLIAGKTGTAQVVGIPQSEKKRMEEHELAFFKRSHAYLTTFAPANDPKYVVTILIEHGGHGGAAAGPIVTEIYNKMIKLGYL